MNELRLSLLLIFILFLLLYSGCSDPVDEIITPSEIDELSVGMAPTGIAVRDNLVYVGNTGYNFSRQKFESGSVTIIDGSKNSVIDSLKVGINPQELSFAPNGELYIICTGDYSSIQGEVYIYNTESGEFSDTLATGGSPAFCAFSGDGLAYVAGFYTGIITIDISTHEILTGYQNPAGFDGSGIAVDNQGNIYVSIFHQDQVQIYSKNFDLLDVIPAGDGPQSLLFNNDYSKLFIINGLGETLTIFDMKSRKAEQNKVLLGRAPNDIVLHGSSLYVVNSYSSNIQVIDENSLITKKIFELGGNRNPMQIAFSEIKRAVTTNLLTNSVCFLNNVP